MKVLAGNTWLTVSWTLPKGAYAALIKWCAPGGQWQVDVGVHGYSIAGLTNDTLYSLQVVFLPVGGMAYALGTPTAGDPPGPMTPPGITLTP